MLLKKQVEKMSVFHFATRLMKTSKLHRPCHDVDDKKGSYKKTPTAMHLPREASDDTLGIVDADLSAQGGLRRSTLRKCLKRGRRPIRMLKMTVDPTMCMKKAHNAKCHGKNAAFYTKMHQVLGNR